MKTAKFKLCLFTLFLLSLGLESKVQAHIESAPIPDELITEDLTNEEKDELIEQYLDGLPELPVTGADIDDIGQQLRNRLNVSDDENLPSVFILPEDIELPPTLPGEWDSFPAGEVNQFNIVTVPFDEIDLPITNAINSSEYGSPFTYSPAFVPPGAGPEPHVHWWDEEWFWVVDGMLDIYLGENVYDTGEIPGVNAPLEENYHHVQVESGEMVFSRAKQLHSFKNNQDEFAILLSFWNRVEETDGGIEQFFLNDEIGQLIDNPFDLPENNGNDPARIARWNELFPEFGVTISSEFDEYLAEDAVVEGLDPEILQDNRSEELVGLLRQIPQLQAEEEVTVPEPSIPSGIFVFGSLLTFSIFRKTKKKCLNPTSV